MQSPSLLSFSSNVFPQPVLVQTDILLICDFQTRLHDQKIWEPLCAGSWARSDGINLPGFAGSGVQGPCAETSQPMKRALTESMKRRKSLSSGDLKANHDLVSHYD